MRKFALVVLLALPVVALAGPKPKVPKAKPGSSVAPVGSITKAIRRIQAVVSGALRYNSWHSSSSERVLPKNYKPALPKLVLPSTERLTNRVLMVVDVSGSMGARDYADALYGVKLLSGGRTDDLRIACYAFDTLSYRWPGVKGKGVLPCWAKFPSAIAQKNLLAWLGARSRDGGTSPEFAMAAALKSPQKDLSIIFISDGVFNQVVLDHAIRRGQALRKKNGLKPARIMAYGVGDHVKSSRSMLSVGKHGRGGFWYARRHNPRATVDRKSH